jgi:hypothetical protein
MHVSNKEGLTESSFNNRNFSGGSVETGECAPIVDDETGTDDFRSSVDGSGDEGNLEQGREFVEFRSGCFGVYETALEISSC